MKEFTTPPLAGKTPTDPGRKKLIIYLTVPLVFFVILQLFVLPSFEVKRLSYSEFYQLVEKNPATNDILSAELVEGAVRGKLRSGAYFQVNIPMNDPEIIPILRRNVPQFTVDAAPSFWKNLVYSVLPVLLLIGFFWFFVYRGVQQGGGKIFSFGKSRAKLLGAGATQITFKDVAGADEAKEEL